MTTPSPVTGRPAVMMLDTENVFASFGWRPDARLRKRVASQLAGDELTPHKDLTRLRTLARWGRELTDGYGYTNAYAALAKADKPLRSLSNWARVLLDKAPTIHSFGNPDNAAVLTVGPHFADFGIRHEDVGDEEHAAERRLLQRFDEIEDDFDVFVFGGRDHEVLDVVQARIEQGWDDKYFAFVFPPDARASAGTSCAGLFTRYGRHLNTHAGAIGVFVWGDFFTYIDVIHVKMTTNRKRDPAARPVRRPLLPPESDSGSGSESESESESGLVSAPAARWTDLAVASLAGRVPLPVGTQRFGEQWVTAAQRTLPASLYEQAPLAARQLAAAAAIAAAGRELDVILDNGPSERAWRQWGAAALRLPVVDRPSPPLRSDPLAGPTARARSWRDSAR